MIVLVIAALGFLITWLLTSIIKEEKRNAMKQSFWNLSKLGSKHRLAFTSQESFGECVFALDGVHRKLLVLPHSKKDDPSPIVIDLEEIARCSLKYNYGAINRGEADNKNLSDYLEQLYIKFELKNGSEPVEVLLYDKSKHGQNKLVALETRARHWKTLLCKLNAPLKQTA